MALLLGSCRPDAKPPDSSPEPSYVVNTAVELQVYDCGRMSLESVEPLGLEDEETEVRELIAPCYVVEHPEGRLLFEGGLPSSVADVEGWQDMGGGWQMRLDQTLAEQLAARGSTLSEFDYLAFSHFHFDHIGIANEVEHATLIVQKPEHEAAFTEGAESRNYQPDLYDNLSSAETVVVHGDHDVFGDGRVRLLATYGHTAGHQSLFVDLAETGPVILSGDLYVLRVGREQQKVLAIDIDAEQSEASMQRVEALAAEAGADVWITHDLEHHLGLGELPSTHR